MQEMEKYMKDFCMNRKGFITVFFLSGFLICSTLVSVSMYIQKKMFEGFLNLRENAEYFKQEVLIIEHIKSELKKDTLMSSEFICDSVSCSMEVQQDTVKVQVYDEKEEILEVLIDTEKKIVLDYTSYRN